MVLRNLDSYHSEQLRRRKKRCRRRIAYVVELRSSDPGAHDYAKKRVRHFTFIMPTRSIPLRHIGVGEPAQALRTAAAPISSLSSPAYSLFYDAKILYGRLVSFADSTNLAECADNREKTTGVARHDRTQGLYKPCPGVHRHKSHAL